MRKNFRKQTTPKKKEQPKKISITKTVRKTVSKGK